MKIKSLPRRAFLQGLGGITVALPFLDIMRPIRALAASATPTRYVIFFDGQSIGGDDDPAEFYTPDKLGTGYDLKTALRPLGGSTLYKGSVDYTAGSSIYNYPSVQNDVNVVTGLRIPYSATGRPADGGWANDFHIQALAPLLTGYRTNMPDNGNAAAYKSFGPSSDQKVADALALSNPGLKFKSLNYCAQKNFYLAGGAGGREILSWNKSGDSVSAEASPHNAYASLFSQGGTQTANPGAAAAAAELKKRKSVLDLVLPQYANLMQNLGSEDRQRLTLHADQIRDLERRLASIPSDAMTCKIPADRFANGDPATSGTYSNEAARAAAFCDLMHIAFACDLSRVGALMLTYAQSHMGIQQVLPGEAADQHDLGHGAGGANRSKKMSRMIAWHVDHYAYFINLLKSTPEDGGTMLDNTVVIFINEGGHGFDPGAGKVWSTHSTENMVAMIAGGKNLGLVPGRHIRLASKAPSGTLPKLDMTLHPAKIMISGMKAVGICDDNGTLGQITGTLPELFKA